MCAERLVERQPLQQDAAEFAPPEPLDGVMFGLSYNTMPHHLAVLHHAWNLLRPGGRLVVMDAKLPPGLGGRLILPFSLWLMKRTMLGNPLIKPWEDVARLAGTIEMEQFMFGSWYICTATKPLDHGANDDGPLTFQALARPLYPVPGNDMAGSGHHERRRASNAGSSTMKSSSRGRRARRRRSSLPTCITPSFTISRRRACWSAPARSSTTPASASAPA